MCHKLVLGIRIFGSDWFDLFGFCVIQVEMLGTRHFSDRFDSGNFMFGSDFYFFIKSKMKLYYK